MGIWQPVNYYFRRVQPVQRSFEVEPGALRESGAGRTDAASYARPSSGTDAPDRSRPIVIWRHYHRTLPTDLRTALPEPIDLRYDVLLLLPGPFGACRAEAGVLDVRR